MLDKLIVNIVCMHFKNFKDSCKSGFEKNRGLFVVALEALRNQERYTFTWWKCTW